MSSHRQIIYQVVFGTKNRESVIPEDYCEELYGYIGGIIKNKNCKQHRINGVKDHIHILSYLHPSISLSDYIKDIKVASSMWMKGDGKFPDFRSWQDGYAALTYSVR